MTAFFDTNVIFHRFDKRDLPKHRTARLLWQQMAEARAAVISSQVLAEFINAVRRKLRPAMTAEQLHVAAASLAPMVKVDSNKGLVLSALELAMRFQLSIYDAMIVQAAIDSGASILYSEDLQDGRRFGPVQVVNPFTQPDLAVNEPAVRYALSGAARRRPARAAAGRAVSKPRSSKAKG
jgi:predicted nucleic acid-binding protein